MNEPTLKIATRIEIRRYAMALPGGPYPKTKSFEVALTDVPRDIQAKYLVSGDLDGWRALAEYGQGNSRMIFAFCLAFVGPLSAVTTVEHVGMQFVGSGGEGKSGIGVVASSAWGWDPDPNVADRNGFGQNWNSTINAVEPTLCGYNQTFLFLNEANLADETGAKQSANILKTIFKIEGSVGKARLNDPVPKRSWFAPVLSTSNISVIEHVRLAAGKRDQADDHIDAAILDRLADIPPPENGHGMFEYLHGYPDVGAFVAALKAKAAANHGVAGREFVRKLLEARKEDRKKLTGWIEKRRKFYIKKATAQITTSGRNLTRLHGKFATVYAAGALAAKFGILPYKRKDVARAVLKCEIDHVRFVEGLLTGRTAQRKSHVELLRDYIRSNLSSFIDLRDKGDELRGSDFKSAPGFIGIHKDRPEYLFAAEKFKEILGGRAAADECKRDLSHLGLIATAGAGKGELRYVVKRSLGDKRRAVVAIDSELLAD